VRAFVSVTGEGLFVGDRAAIVEFPRAAVGVVDVDRWITYFSYGRIGEIDCCRARAAADFAPGSSCHGRRVCVTEGVRGQGASRVSAGQRGKWRDCHGRAGHCSQDTASIVHNGSKGSGVGGIRVVDRDRATHREVTVSHRAGHGNRILRRAAVAGEQVPLLRRHGLVDIPRVGAGEAGVGGLAHLDKVVPAEGDMADIFVLISIQAGVALRLGVVKPDVSALTSLDDHSADPIGCAPVKDFPIAV